MADDGFINFMENDLAAIMDSRGFDQAMEFLPDERGPVSFRGIFSAPTEEQTLGGTLNPATAQNYSVTYQETALPRRLKRGDLIRARGEIWKIYKAHSDGQGLLTVIIHKAQL